jgi:hypothetical protein
MICSEVLREQFQKIFCRTVFAEYIAGMCNGATRSQ